SHPFRSHFNFVDRVGTWRGPIIKNHTAKTKGASMPNQRREDVSLVVLMKNAYPRVRKYLVYALVIALTMSSALPDPTYRAAVLSALGVTLLFLLFDIHNEPNTRLSGIEECVRSPAPPQFPDFRAAGEEIYQTIEASLVEAQKVSLDLLTISGSYSWRF